MQGKIENIEDKAREFLSKSENDEKILGVKIEVLKKYDDIWNEFVYFINTGEYVDKTSLNPVIVYGYSAYQLSQYPYYFPDELPFAALAFLRTEGFCGDTFKHIKKLEVIEREAVKKGRDVRREPLNIIDVIQTYENLKTTANLCALYRMLDKSKLYIVPYALANGSQNDFRSNTEKEIFNIYLDKYFAYTQHGKMDCVTELIKFNDIHNYKDPEASIILNYESKHGKPGEPSRH